MTAPEEDRSLLVRAALITVGTISLGLGIIGILLPLVPTTPFLLLTAACYARSSKRLNAWLVNHPRLGPYINRWRRDRTVPRRAKVLGIALMWVSFALGTHFVIESFWPRIAYLAIVIVVSAFLMTLRTAPSAKEVRRRQPHGSHDL